MTGFELTPHTTVGRAGTRAINVLKTDFNIMLILVLKSISNLWEQKHRQASRGYVMLTLNPIGIGYQVLYQI